MPGQIFDLGNYPGACYIQGSNTKVSGEVFKMDDPDKMLKVLDEYEGISPEVPEPHEYVRQLCPITCNNDELICWVYIYYCVI